MNRKKRFIAKSIMKKTNKQLQKKIKSIIKKTKKQFQKNIKNKMKQNNKFFVFFVESILIKKILMSIFKCQNINNMKKSK